MKPGSGTSSRSSRLTTWVSMRLTLRAGPWTSCHRNGGSSSRPTCTGDIRDPNVQADGEPREAARHGRPRVADRSGAASQACRATRRHRERTPPRAVRRVVQFHGGVRRAGATCALRICGAAVKQSDHRGRDDRGAQGAWPLRAPLHDC